MNRPTTLTELRIFFVPLLIAGLLKKSPNFDFRGFQMHFWQVLGVLILLPGCGHGLGRRVFCAAKHDFR